MVSEYQEDKYRMSKVKVYTFQYEEPFFNHYFYRGAMANHNGMCHDLKTKSRLDSRICGLPTGWQS